MSPPKSMVASPLNKDGSLDTSFGTNGETTTEFSGESAALIASMVLLPDGKILAVGSTFDASDNFSVALAEYTAH